MQLQAPSSFLHKAVNKLDAKGRVSIPAPYRQLLAQENLNGVFCIPSFFSDALEGFGETLLAEFRQRLRKSDPLLDEAHDDLAHAVCTQAQFLNFDDEGRVRLPEDLIHHAGIVDRVAFIGLDQKFQMWDPTRLEPVERDRLARVRAMRRGNGGAS